MAYDLLMTRTIAMGSAATYLPLGNLAPGDAGNFDEIDLSYAPMGRPLYPVVHVPQMTGGTPSMQVTVETSSDAAFSSPAAQTVLTMPAITAAGKYVGSGFAGTPTTYARFKAVSTGAGDWGTPTFTLTPDPDSAWLTA